MNWQCFAVRGYTSTPSWFDKMVLIFCNSSFLTVSGTRVRAFGVICFTIFSTLTLPPSSLITSRHNNRTSSFQPHSVNRSRSKSFSLCIKEKYHLEKKCSIKFAKIHIYLVRSPCKIVVWSTTFVNVIVVFVSILSKICL